MANRFSTRQRGMIMNFLVERDGCYCLICKKHPPQVKLQIDHADNNPCNWDSPNLHLLCQQDNLILRDKTTHEHKWIINNYATANARERMSRRVTESTNEVKEKIDYDSGSAEMKANSYFETQFVQWVLEEMNRNEVLFKKEIINSGAHVVGCSQITAARYLDKLTSSAGPLEIIKHAMGSAAVRFREKFQTKPEITPSKPGNPVPEKKEQ